MSIVLLRLSEEDKDTIQSYAKLQGKNVSEVLKEAFFEKLEDEMDLATIHEFEKEKRKETYLTLSETMKGLES